MSALSQQASDGDKQERSTLVGELCPPDFPDTTFRNRKLNDAEFSLKTIEKWGKLNNTMQIYTVLT